MIMRGRAVLERAKTTKKVKLLDPEKGDLGKTLSARQHGEQAQQQDLIERVADLAGLARVPQIIEMTQEHNRLVECRTVRCRAAHAYPRSENRGLA